MNFRFQEEDVLTIPAPTGGVTVGQFVQIGDLFGFAQSTAAAGIVFGLIRCGRVLDAPKGNVAIGAGQPLFYDATNTCFTNVPQGAASPVAVSVQAAAQADATVDLVLVPTTDVDSTGPGGDIKADGTVPFTAAIAGVDGSDPADLATKGYVDAFWPAEVPASATATIDGTSGNATASVTANALRALLTIDLGDTGIAPGKTLTVTVSNSRIGPNTWLCLYMGKKAGDAGQTGDLDSDHNAGTMNIVGAGSGTIVLTAASGDGAVNLNKRVLVKVVLPDPT